jgi:hypothetical protein
MTADLFLVHGGLWDTMDAEHFWRTPGIVAGLESTGSVPEGKSGCSTRPWARRRARTPPVEWVSR